MKNFRQYDIGVPGRPWGAEERQQWLKRQVKQRSYEDLVVLPLKSMMSRNPALYQAASIVEYGTVDYTSIGQGAYRLYALKSQPWRDDRPTAIVTGGVHGYETSGVLGALLFIQNHFIETARAVNVLVLPCVTPWAFETVNRWTPLAVDPNRSFNRDKPGCEEAGLAMACIRSQLGKSPALVHIDLHETTDTDNSEFTPAKIARDGLAAEKWSEIPDGFYLVGDARRPQIIFQQAMLDAVRRVTHLAAADEDGCIIGDPLVIPHLVHYDCAKYYLCGGHTDAPYVTTTEVYPDSKRTTPEECNAAQAACVVAGIQFAINATAGSRH